MICCALIAVLLALVSRPMLAFRTNPLAWRPAPAKSLRSGPLRSRGRADSFAHAAAGMVFAVRNEPNMRIHLAVAAIVVATGLWLRLDLVAWRWLGLAIALVLMMELINTAIEQACNAVTVEHRAAIKAAKDVAAAAVLLSACFAGLVGLTIFLPHAPSISTFVPSVICTVALP